MNRAVRAAMALLAAAVLGRSSMAAPEQDLRERMGRLLPPAVMGWEAAGAGDLYDPETIFSYIDGAGEVYRAYNFRQLLSRRYEKKDGLEIIVDLFDMGSPADAFGVNTMDLEGEDPGIGQGGTYKDGLLSFWRDRYFVSVAAGSETAESRAACLEFGRKIAAAIGKDSPRPSLLEALPAGLAPEKAVRYLHSHVILNRHFFLSPENVLRLGPDVEAVLARMGEKGREGALLIVRYPNERAASEAFASLQAALPNLGRGPAGPGIQADKRGAIRLGETTFAAVLGAPSQEAVKTILDRIVARMKKGDPE